MKKTIYLQKIGNIDHMILLDLKKELKICFKDYIRSVEISDNSIPLDEFRFDSINMKYNGTEILNILSDYHDKSEFLSIIGLIDEDIKSRKRKYVFGMIKTKNQLFLTRNGISNKSRLALISIYRLRENFYSRPENNSLFKKRIMKITVHEIGHSLGLKKCKNNCIMKCKGTVTEVDKKSSNFCKECQEYLKSLFNNLK